MANYNRKDVFEFIDKWIPLLEKIDNDESLKSRCRKYDAYGTFQYRDTTAIEEELHFWSFWDEADKSGIVVTDYVSFTEGKEELVFNPTDEFIQSLSLDNVLRCIACHFREERWREGFLIKESFTNGSLLKLFKAAKGKL